MEFQEIKTYSEAEPQELINFCEACYGYEPCLCASHEYRPITKFVYDCFLNCNPTI